MSIGEHIKQRDLFVMCVILITLLSSFTGWTAYTVTSNLTEVRTANTGDKYIRVTIKGRIAYINANKITCIEASSDMSDTIITTVSGQIQTSTQLFEVKRALGM